MEWGMRTMERLMQMVAENKKLLERSLEQGERMEKRIMGRMDRMEIRIGAIESCIRGGNFRSGDAEIERGQEEGAGNPGQLVEVTVKEEIEEWIPPDVPDSQEPFEDTMNQAQDNEDAHYGFETSADPSANNEAHPEDLYCCGICNSTFRYPSDLEVHVLEHSQRRIAASSCSQVERSSVKNATQPNTVQAKPQKSVQNKSANRCGVCRKTFNRPSLLEVHMRKHTGEKPFSCYVCQKGFTQRGALRRHINMHTGEKSYPCHFCSRVFFRLDSWQKHIWMHTGENRFECRVCGKHFSSPSNLRTHMRIHERNNPSQMHLPGRT